MPSRKFKTCNQSSDFILFLLNFNSFNHLKMLKQGATYKFKTVAALPNVCNTIE